jgi:hypothetical protein
VASESYVPEITRFVYVYRPWQREICALSFPEIMIVSLD